MNTDARFGDTAVNFPDPSTVVLEYDDANESQEMAPAISWGRQALRSNAERLTKMTEDSEPDITLTYEEPGRTIAREETVSVSNRSDSSICPISTFLFASFFFRKEKEEGDKLKLVDTDFPGETDVSFIYDGSLDTRPLARVSSDAAHSQCECPGKRRYKAVDPDGGNTVTWYRWARPSDDSLDVSRGETSGEAAHLRGKCAGWNVLAEYADTGDFWDIGTLQRTYVPELGYLMGSDASTAPCFSELLNVQGSVTAVVNAARDATATREYDPYGEQLKEAGDSGGFGFSRLFQEEDAGGYYAPFRYYDAALARWAGRDPWGKSDQNLYSYCAHDPINSIDPLGDEAIERCHERTDREVLGKRYVQRKFTRELMYSTDCEEWCLFIEYTQWEKRELVHHLKICVSSGGCAGPTTTTIEESHEEHVIKVWWELTAFVRNMPGYDKDKNAWCRDPWTSVWYRMGPTHLDEGCNNYPDIPTYFPLR